FLKVSPLGGSEAVDRVLGAADAHPFVCGFMFNLTPVKPAGLKTPASVLLTMPGAISGPPAAAHLANQCIVECYQRMDRKRFALIGAGGIATAAAAYAMIRRGASLVQLLTAMVYDGPLLARRIALGLAALLERDGFRSVAEAVGADVR